MIQLIGQAFNAIIMGFTPLQSNSETMIVSFELSNCLQVQKEKRSTIRILPKNIA